MSSEIRSYTSGQGNGNPLAEFVRLFRRSRTVKRDYGATVAGALKRLRECEDQVAREASLRLEGRKVLEVGCGQLIGDLVYFARRNDAQGVDLDVAPQGFNVPQYVRMLRRNGAKRLLKTVARKALGFDRGLHREMRRQLGGARLPRPVVREMDATRLDFPDASFDFVYSFSVFEHLPDPAAVLRETRRILKPGGVSYQHLHLYTSDDGCHDLRILGDERNGMPYWPHLRPQHAGDVQAFAYLNKLHLADWRRIADAEMPDSRFLHDMDAGRLAEALADLRRAGELADYTDQELLTHNLIMVWTKPPAGAQPTGTS